MPTPSLEPGRPQPAPDATPADDSSPGASRAARTASRDSKRQRAAAPRAKPDEDTTQLLKPASAPATRSARRLADAGSTGVRGRAAPTAAAVDPRPAERSPRTGARRGPANP